MMQIDIAVDPVVHIEEDNQNQQAYEKNSNDLCRAILKGDWKTTKHFIVEDRSILYAKLTKSWDRVIHLAVHSKNISFVKKLVDFLTVDELAIENQNKDTGLNIAAVSGTIEIAKLMVNKNSKLTMLRGTRELIPFGIAAEAGHKKMAEYLYPKTQFDCLDPGERVKLFFITINSNLYGLALDILNNDPTLACARDNDEKTALHVLAQKATHDDWKTTLHVLAQKATHIASGSLQKIMARYTSLGFKGFCKQGSMIGSAHELLKVIWKQVLKQSKEEILDLLREPPGVLFEAAMSGNDEFLALLLGSYIDLLWEVNDRGQSVFHVAVLHRQVQVFNLIKNIGAAKEYIVGFIDSDNNNMLHLAGMLPQGGRLGTPRANLQVQRELLWFKEVKKIVQPSDKNKKNSKGMTPKEVFDKEHKDLLKVGEEAMRETSKSCMIVATLISTMVFAAALTVPGASNNISNTPFFNKDHWFKIFILSNAVALFTSIASIVLSLSILTSSYEVSDFVYLLHARLIFGLTTLFISITTMVLAFIAAIILIFDHKGERVQYVIAVLGCSPAILFLILYYNLLADLIRSFYWSWFLSRRSKHQIF